LENKIIWRIKVYSNFFYRLEVIFKHEKNVRRNKNRSSGGDSLLIDEEEVKKSFWFSRRDGWVVNRKMKKIIFLEFKRTVDYEESYYRDMWRVSEQHHTPILMG
jgi:hypothetical protein